MDHGFRPDSYVDTHPKVSLRKPVVKAKPGSTPVTQMKQDMQELRTEKEMMSAELGYLQKELEDDVKRIQSLENEIKKLNMALAAAHEQQEELEKHRDVLKNEVATLKEALRSMTAERDALLEKVAQLNAENERLTGVVNAAEERYSALDAERHAQLAEAAARYDSLAKSTGETIERQAGELGVLTAERDALRGRAMKAEERVAALEKSEAELTRLNHQYQLQLQVVKRETQQQEGAVASRKQRELQQQVCVLGVLIGQHCSVSLLLCSLSVGFTLLTPVCFVLFRRMNLRWASSALPHL